MLKYTFLLLFAFCSHLLLAQKVAFTRQDSLRGTITKERAWWDLTYYHLNIEVTPADSTIHGANTIQFRVLQPHQMMQIDLQAPMNLKKVIQNGKELGFTREGNAYFIKLNEDQKPG